MKVSVVETMSSVFGDPCKRLERYVRNLERALSSIEILDHSVAKVVELARLYLEDSKYYAAKGDCVTGLVTVSYAEGLLDALRLSGSVEFSWPTGSALEEVRVFAAGSFDILHPGHVAYLRWASSLGTKLFVVVSRDATYRRVKGVEPVMDEMCRLELVKAVRYVYDARLGDEVDQLKPVEEIKPHVIALGPDQRVDESWLRKELARRGLGDVKVVRMGSRVGSLSSSSIKMRLAKILCRDVTD